MLHISISAAQRWAVDIHLYRNSILRWTWMRNWTDVSRVQKWCASRKVLLMTRTVHTVCCLQFRQRGRISYCGQVSILRLKSEWMNECMNGWKCSFVRVSLVGDEQIINLFMISSADDGSDMGFYLVYWVNLFMWCAMCPFVRANFITFLSPAKHYTNWITRYICYMLSLSSINQQQFAQRLASHHRHTHDTLKHICNAFTHGLQLFNGNVDCIRVFCTHTHTDACENHEVKRSDEMWIWNKWKMFEKWKMKMFFAQNHIKLMCQVQKTETEVCTTAHILKRNFLIQEYFTTFIMELIRVCVLFVSRSYLVSKCKKDKFKM